MNLVNARYGSEPGLKACGMTIDRDLNTAINIRNRAFGPEEQSGNSHGAPPRSWNYSKDQSIRIGR